MKIKRFFYICFLFVHFLVFHSIYPNKSKHCLIIIIKVWKKKIISVCFLSLALFFFSKTSALANVLLVLIVVLYPLFNSFFVHSLEQCNWLNFAENKVHISIRLPKKICLLYVWKSSNEKKCWSINKIVLMLVMIYQSRHFIRCFGVWYRRCQICIQLNSNSKKELPERNCVELLLRLQICLPTPNIIKFHEMLWSQRFFFARSRLKNVLKYPII